MEQTGTCYLGAVFRISTRVLSPDLRRQVGRSNETCLALIEHPIDAQHFRVRIAADWEALQTEEHAYMSVLSRFQLSLANARRIGCSDVINAVQVAPAFVLPLEMRSLYSSAGLCYYIPTGTSDQNGRQEVTVAALPERLHPYNRGRIGTVLLDEEQRRCALDYTAGLAALSTCDLRACVLALWSGLLPNVLEEAETELVAQKHSPRTRKSDVQAPTSKPSLQSLEKVFVPLETVTWAVESLVKDRHSVKRWRERLWLRAALYTLSWRKAHASQRHADLDRKIRKVLVVDLYRPDLPRLVEVDPVYQRGRIIGYDIRVSAPIEMVAAA